MAIVDSDIKRHLTGAASDGGTQTDADSSLGNYRSSSEITSGNDNNLFDDVSGAQAQAGHTDYRCIALQNKHATLALTEAKVYISTDDANSDTTYSIAVERPSTAGATNGNAQGPVANENTAPTVNTTDHNGSGSGISNWALSTAANSYANGISVQQGSHDDDLDVDEIIFVWIKRVIGASASAANAVAFTITLEGNTAA